MNSTTTSRARSDLADHHEGMQRLRARLQDIQMIAMRLAEPERFAQQEQALVDDVAERNRETVRQWLAGQLNGGSPSDVPLDAIDVDTDNAERVRDWERIKKAIAPAIAELQDRQRHTTQALIEAEQSMPALVDAVIAEGVPELEIQFAAAVSQARTLAARIEAVRTHFAGRKNYRLIETIGRGFADVIPEQADLKTAGERWGRFATALAANPHATVEP